jgi:hypothetical protein
MPLGSVLELSLEPVEYGASILSEEPADDASDGRATTMRVDGDALVTVSRPGEYRMRLVLRTRGKPDCDVPVQPASFTVTGDDERQRIVLEAAFASATAIDPAR